MALPLPVRIAALLAAGWWGTGCSREPAPVNAGKGYAGAPRRLAVPSGIRPLPLDSRSPAVLQQAAATAPASGARILEFAAPRQDAPENTIRQPGAQPQPPAIAATKRQPEVREPPAPQGAPDHSPPLTAGTTPRSEFVPLAAPPAAAAPPELPLPHLPAVPNFNVAAPTASRFNASYAIAPPSAPPPAAASPPPVPGSPPAPVAVPSAVPRTFPVTTSHDTNLQVALQQVRAQADRGLAMAQRGMLYAGRTELTKALQLLAQTLDTQQSTSAHSFALAGGLTALAEARDFSPLAHSSAAVVDVCGVAQTHRTLLLKHDSTASGLSPVAAQQQYCAYAQQQLVAAAGGQPVASEVLYRLGRLATALAAHDSAPHALHGAQALVYQQAALAVDPRNYLAANEAGVLLAGYGQLEAAKQLLVRSVSLRPQLESWHNLAVVHRRLGESELARQADRERDLLAQKTIGPSAAARLVHWVDPRTFAASSRSDAPWPGATAAAASSSAAGQRR